MKIPRDLKPGDVIVDNHGTQHTVKYVSGVRHQWLRAVPQDRHRKTHEAGEQAVTDPIPDHIEIPHRGDCTPLSVADAAWIFTQGGGAKVLQRIAALESVRPAQIWSDDYLNMKQIAIYNAEIASLREKLAEARNERDIEADEAVKLRAKLADAEAMRPKARVHDDAHAMLDTLGIARRSDNGAEFTLQHRIGVLNDDAEREKGAAYRDAAAAEAKAADYKTQRDTWHDRHQALAAATRRRMNWLPSGRS